MDKEQLLGERMRPGVEYGINIVSVGMLTDLLSAIVWGLPHILSLPV